MTVSLAQQIAEQSIVLLKNTGGLLPLPEAAKVAAFGRSQLKTYFSGNGSGGTRNGGTSILDACEQAGLRTAPALSAYYRRQAVFEPQNRGLDWDLLEKTGNSGLAYEMFAQYYPPAEEYPVSQALIQDARGFSDTALLILGRDSGGEECDRRLQEDYYLTSSEQALLEAVCTAFPKVALVLNVNGLMDLSWTDTYPSICSILFLGIPGEDGAAAFANILLGRVNPCGKLCVTIARSYQDYPAARDFSFNKEAPLTYGDYGLNTAENGSTGYAKSPVTVYREGVFVGYRYFDALGKEPLYPFGFGLSYTSFSIKLVRLTQKRGELLAEVAVSNTGNIQGREVVQIYQRPRGVRTDQPPQKLWGFAKTALLVPGECETLTLHLPWNELAAYEEDTSAWVIEAGQYGVALGNSSRNAEEIGCVSVPEDILLEACKPRLGTKPCNRSKIEWLSRPAPEALEATCTIVLTAQDIVPNSKSAAVALPPLPELTVQELAALCVGYGPGIPFASLSSQVLPNTVCGEDGSPLAVSDHPDTRLGYISPAIPTKGIHSVSYKDGPAGVGNVAWPTEMLMACSFDCKLWRAFGKAVGRECKAARIDFWLAPAVNLHRNPLGGRNFEYFSEDPYLTGCCGVEIALGAKAAGTKVCPKHFAANEQETCRRGSTKKNIDAVDSVLTERTLREIYLKPFEMLVRQAHICSLMTSFNKINGVFAAGSRDLCTHILREEWGFRGAVVTDWGDMDVVVDGADAIAAGNDIIMPGGPPVIEQILRAYKIGRLTRRDMEISVQHLLQMVGS